MALAADVGHGRHLQEVFEFIHRLASQAHRLGGRIVWTLGNHDLYEDREGGQGGEDSLGYRLWPKIREAALHPERHPGLVVQAAYFDHGKLFVHAGLLPNIVDIAMREQGARGPEEIASYVNHVFRRALVDRERIRARDRLNEPRNQGSNRLEIRGRRHVDGRTSRCGLLGTTCACVADVLSRYYSGQQSWRRFARRHALEFIEDQQGPLTQREVSDMVLEAQRARGVL